MTLEPTILYVVLPYSLLSAGLLSGLYLFFTLKAQIRTLHNKCDSQAAKFELAAEESNIRCAGLQLEIEHLRERVSPPSPSSPTARAFRRAKILGMHERGEGVSSIANTLGIPDAHVDLMLKVHRLASAVSESGAQRPEGRGPELLARQA
jgi:hypothetical protein